MSSSHSDSTATWKWLRINYIYKQLILNTDSPPPSMLFCLQTVDHLINDDSCLTECTPTWRISIMAMKNWAKWLINCSTRNGGRFWTIWRSRHLTHFRESSRSTLTHSWPRSRSGICSLSNGWLVSNANYNWNWNRKQNVSFLLCSLCW